MFGFDPLSWAIGYAASEGVDWARANIGGGLDSALASAAEEWADDLPNKYYIEEHRSLLKTLLSPPTTQEQQAEELSNRRKLAITLGDSEIPSEEQWLAALLERWEEVRRATSGELQDFFTISEEEAENHLRDLSERFVQICLEEPKRFRRTVFGRLNDLEERVEGLSHSRSDPNSAGRRSGLGWRLVHPYPLLPGFSGRERERRELSHWLNGQNAPLYLLFAQGGFGKSALAWYWLHHDVEQEKWPQVIWWSFYESESGFDHFLNYMSDTLDVSSTSNRRECVEEIIDIMNKERLLLVLDGFEQLLRGYSKDKNVKDEANTSISNRDVVELLVERFLLRVANLGSGQSKVLLTSRPRPKALEKHGRLISGVSERKLEGLRPEDSVSLFKQIGIEGRDSEIKEICNRYGHHPLSLRVLGGYILNHPSLPGQLSAVEDLELERDLQDERAHLFKRTLNSLSNDLRLILRIMSCLREPIDSQGLDKMIGDNTIRLNYSVRELVVRGLLNYNKSTQLISIHPVVSSFVYDRLDTISRHKLHKRARDYYSKGKLPEDIDFGTAESSIDAENAEDLSDTIEWALHIAKSGDYEDACSLIRKKLHEPLYNWFGSYHEYSELLSVFLDDKNDKLKLDTYDNQSWLLNALANTYCDIGEPLRAESLYNTSLSLDRSEGNERREALSASNLAYKAQIPTGQFKLARENLELSLSRYKKIGYIVGKAIALRELGRLEKMTASYTKSNEKLKASRELLHDPSRETLMSVFKVYDEKPTESKWVFLKEYFDQHKKKADTYRVFLLIEQQETEDARKIAEELFATTDNMEGLSSRQLPSRMRAAWALGAALSASGETYPARLKLERSLTLCRQMNKLEFEPPILLDLASTHVELDHLSRGLEMAKEAKAIAERSDYRIYNADACLWLAEANFDVGNIPEAVTYAKSSRDLSLCGARLSDCYREVYERSSYLLEKYAE